MEKIRPSFASSKDMTGTSYQTSVVLSNDPERKALSEKQLDDSKKEAMDVIVEIDRLVYSGAYTKNQVRRMRLKQRILFGRVALVEYGKSA